MTHGSQAYVHVQQAHIIYTRVMLSFLYRYFSPFLFSFLLLFVFLVDWNKKGEGIVNGRIARQATDDYYLTGFNFPFRIPSQLLHKFTRTAHTFLRRICTYLNRLFYSVNVFTIVVAVFFCTFVWKKGQTTYIGTHCIEHFFGNCAFSHYKRTCVEITSSSFLLAQDFGLARERWKTKTINNNIEPTEEKTGEIAKHTHEKMNIWPIKTYFRMSSLGNSFIPKLSVCVCQNFTSRLRQSNGSSNKSKRKGCKNSKTFSH